MRAKSVMSVYVSCICVARLEAARAIGIFAGHGASTGARGVTGQRLDRARDEESLESAVLAHTGGATKAKTRPQRCAGVLAVDRGRIGRGRVTGMNGQGVCLLGVGNERGCAAVKLIARDDGRGQRGLLRVVPLSEAAAGTAALAEDEASEDIEAADGEQEEGRDEREIADTVRQDRGTDQALENAESTNAKVWTEHGEVGGKELAGPANLGQEEKDDLEDDEESVDNCPERAGRLIRNSRSLKVIEAFGLIEGLVIDDLWLSGALDRVDVIDKNDDRGRKDEDEANEREETNGVETEEDGDAGLHSGTEGKVTGSGGVREVDCK